MTTERALALWLVRRDGTRTTVYLDWPGAESVDPDSRLGRSLAALDISAVSFADIYG